MSLKLEKLTTDFSDERPSAVGGDTRSLDPDCFNRPNYFQLAVTVMTGRLYANYQSDANYPL